MQPGTVSVSVSVATNRGGRWPNMVHAEVIRDVPKITADDHVVMQRQVSPAPVERKTVEVPGYRHS